MRAPRPAKATDGIRDGTKSYRRSVKPSFLYVLQRGGFHLREFFEYGNGNLLSGFYAGHILAKAFQKCPDMANVRHKFLRFIAFCQVNDDSLFFRIAQFQ